MSINSVPSNSPLGNYKPQEIQHIQQQIMALVDTLQKHYPEAMSLESPFSERPISGNNNAYGVVSQLSEMSSSNIDSNNMYANYLAHVLAEGIKELSAVTERVNQVLQELEDAGFQVDKEKDSAMLTELTQGKSLGLITEYIKEIMARGGETSQADAYTPDNTTQQAYNYSSPAPATNTSQPQSNNHQPSIGSTQQAGNSGFTPIKSTSPGAILANKILSGEQLSPEDARTYHNNKNYPVAMSEGRLSLQGDTLINNDTGKTVNIPKPA